MLVRVRMCACACACALSVALLLAQQNCLFLCVVNFDHMTWSFAERDAAMRACVRVCARACVWLLVAR